jgi:hypothetical protein
VARWLGWLALALLFGVRAAPFAGASEEPLARAQHEYKSVNCPDGDVYLILDPDGSFTLVLDRIDAKQGTSLGQQKLTGKWQEMKGEVKLDSKESQIVYRREPASFKIGEQTFTLQGLGWQRSSRPTFADSWMLVDRLELQKIVYRYGPAPSREHP